MVTDRQVEGAATVALVAGSTAGHLSPALAVAEAIGRSSPAVRCMLLLPESTSGAWVLEGSGLGVVRIDARPFEGVGLAERLALPAHVLGATLAARRALRCGAVGALLGFGGFGTLEAALAARSLGVPVLLHEANARAGLSTRFASRLAKAVFVAEESALADFPAGRGVVVGMPVRAGFLEAASRRAARIAAAPRAAARRVLVTGGSLGAPFFETRAPSLLARVRATGIDMEVTHLAGRGDTRAIEAAWREAGVPATVLSHATDMASLLVESDFVLSQAGASSFAEIRAVGVPALFVPLPGHAGDHQTTNLLVASRREAIWWVRESDWDEGAIAAKLAVVLRDRVEVPPRAEAGSASRLAAALLEAAGLAACPPEAGRA